MAVAGRVLATFSSQARGIKFNDVSMSSIRVRDSLEFRQSMNVFSCCTAATLVKTQGELGEFPTIRAPHTCAVKRHVLQ